MKKLLLALLVLSLVIGTSLTALAYEDRRDHDWNDEYWHHHHYGYWHGERGYWRHYDHKHEFIRVGPELNGFRTSLADEGITFTAEYVAEVWGNPVGGESTGAVYTGLMSLQGNVDLQKLLGWAGASFSTRWYWLSGHDISADYIGNIFTVSNIAGFPTFRMNELWFQQNFLNDRISIRVGQLGTDSQFDLSTYSAWNYGVYLVADQMLYQVLQTNFIPAVDNKNKQTVAVSPINKGLGIFTHVGVGPPNSSLINFNIDGGLNYKGLVPTRDSDILGLAIAYGHLSNNPPHSQGSSDRGYEIVLEITYQIELTPWLSLQPDVQYVIHPSGTDIPNALVLGAHTTVSF